MINHEEQFRGPGSMFLYAAALILFLEWLYPLVIVFEDTRIDMFIIFTVACFIIIYMRLNRVITFLIIGGIFLIIIHILYFEMSIFNLSWIFILFNEIWLNINLMTSGRWFDLTVLFRTLLCLLLIWSMALLLYRLVAIKKEAFFFIVLTVIMIAVLDTYTIYDGISSIIRIFIISLLILGITGIQKVSDEKNVQLTHKQKWLFWILPLIVFVAVVTSAGMQGPKPGPQWNNPFTFLERQYYSSFEDGEGGSGAGITRIGYSQDDSVLGGTLVMDDSLVFEAEVESDHYWRLETKDVYTGQGWELSSESIPVLQMNGNISFSTFYNENVATEPLNASLDYRNGVGLIVSAYPYGVTNMRSEADMNFYYFQSNEMIQLQHDSVSVETMGYYEISYEQPLFDSDELRESNGSDPDEVVERYTQLPDNLPERVYELSSEITEPFDTRFDQARAVENHFNSSEFEYQLEDVPTAGEEEDYVDQFLFETQYGYCDNYSTAMVVMLRTLDIPARWVKGFTSGERTENQGDDETYINEITNSNAHSWVEVYFPETGWVPFEPTKGFSNLTDFNEEESDEEIPDITESEIPEPEMPDETDTNNEFEDGGTDQNHESWFSFSPSVLLIISGLLFLSLVTLLVIKRKTIRIYMIHKQMKNNLNNKTFEKGYLYLVKCLNRTIRQRKEDETLREYARRVDKRIHSNEMSRLTRIYEEMLYNQKEINASDDIIHLWKNIIDYTKP